jgi:hypothetical protein
MIDMKSGKLPRRKRVAVPAADCRFLDVVPEHLWQGRLGAKERHRRLNMNLLTLVFGRGYHFFAREVDALSSEDGPSGVRIISGEWLARLKR